MIENIDELLKRDGLVIAEALSGKENWVSTMRIDEHSTELRFVFYKGDYYFRVYALPNKKIFGYIKEFDYVSVESEDFPLEDDDDWKKFLKLMAVC